MGKAGNIAKALKNPKEATKAGIKKIMLSVLSFISPVLLGILLIAVIVGAFMAIGEWFKGAWKGIVKFFAGTAAAIDTNDIIELVKTLEDDGVAMEGLGFHPINHWELEDSEKEGLSAEAIRKKTIKKAVDEEIGDYFRSYIAADIESFSKDKVTVKKPDGSNADIDYLTGEGVEGFKIKINSTGETIDLTEEISNNAMPKEVPIALALSTMNPGFAQDIAEAQGNIEVTLFENIVTTTKCTNITKVVKDGYGGTEISADNLPSEIKSENNLGNTETTTTTTYEARVTKTSTWWGDTEIAYEKSTDTEDLNALEDEGGWMILSSSDGVQYLIYTKTTSTSSKSEYMKTGETTTGENLVLEAAKGPPEDVVGAILEGIQTAFVGSKYQYMYWVPGEEAYKPVEVSDSVPIALTLLSDKKYRKHRNKLIETLQELGIDTQGAEIEEEEDYLSENFNRLAWPVDAEPPKKWEPGSKIFTEIPAPDGATVKATQEGKFKMSTTDSHAGTIINTDNSTAYRNVQFSISDGVQVKKGDVIGRIVTGKQLAIRIIDKGGKTVPINSSVISIPGRDSWLWPVPYTHNVTQGFYGTFNTSGHGALDISSGGVSGQPAVATRDGVVIHAGDRGDGYGYSVVIDHGNVNGKRLFSRYAHGWSVSVKAGDKVYQGDEVLKIGSTGMSTGPHLHFEIRQGSLWGTKLDPAKFVK